MLGGHLGYPDYLDSYEVSGENLAVHIPEQLNPLCGTAFELPSQVSLVFSTLSDRANLRLAERQLTVVGERGNTLVFEPLPEEENLDLEGTTWSLLASVGPNPYLE